MTANENVNLFHILENKQNNIQLKGKSFHFKLNFNFSISFTLVVTSLAVCR